MASFVVVLVFAVVSAEEAIMSAPKAGLTTTNVDTSGDTSGDTSLDTSGNTSSATSFVTSVDTNDSTSVDISGGTIGGTRVDTSGGTSVVTSADTSGGTSVDTSVNTSGGTTVVTSIDTSGGTSVDTSSDDEKQHVFRCDEETNYYSMTHDREMGVEEGIDRVETTADGGKVWEVMGANLDQSLTWEENGKLSLDCSGVTYLPETQRFEWPGKLWSYGIGDSVGGGNYLLHMCADSDRDVFFYRYGQDGPEAQMFAELYIKKTTAKVQHDGLLEVVLSDADPLLLYSLLMAGNSSLCDYVETKAPSILGSGGVRTRTANTVAMPQNGGISLANAVVSTILQEHYLPELNNLGFGKIDWLVYDGFVSRDDCKDCKELSKNTEKRAKSKRHCMKICAKSIDRNKYTLFNKPKGGCNKLCKAWEKGRTKEYFCERRNNYCS